MKRMALAAACTVALVVPLAGAAVADRINGTSGDDVIYGTPGSDSISGRKGNDDLFGRAGGDWLLGGSGRDVILGGTGGDDISGGAGGDHLRGNVGNDSIIDFVATEFGPQLPADNDRLLAGRGNDIVGFSNGRDVVYGGRGADELRTLRDTAVDRIDCGPGTNDVLAYYGLRDEKDVVKDCERVVRRPVGPLLP